MRIEAIWRSDLYDCRPQLFIPCEASDEIVGNALWTEGAVLADIPQIRGHREMRIIPSDSPP